IRSGLMFVLHAMNIVSYLWLTFVIYRVGAAMNVKRTEVRESTFSRGTYTAVIAIGALFVFTRYVAIGMLDARFVPISPRVILTGILTALLGLGFAVWARYHLERNTAES
ncbi:MAG: hypothetical protein ACRD2G_06960, partial [Terriglobia bacterium]